jgi:hypothetical protein
MLTGKLITLLDLLQHKHLSNTRLAPARNDQGRDFIDDAAASGGVLKRVNQAKSEQDDGVAREAICARANCSVHP